MQIMFMYHLHSPLQGKPGWKPWIKTLNDLLFVVLKRISDCFRLKNVGSEFSGQVFASNL